MREPQGPPLMDGEKSTDRAGTKVPRCPAWEKDGCRPVLCLGGHEAGLALPHRASQRLMVPAEEVCRAEDTQELRSTGEL